MNALKNLWAKAVKAFHEAKTKATTYVALLVASAGELRGMWQWIVDNLPKGRLITWLETHAFALLGVAMVWARIRRALQQPAPPAT